MQGNRPQAVGGSCPRNPVGRRPSGEDQVEGRAFRGCRGAVLAGAAAHPGSPDIQGVLQEGQSPHPVTSVTPGNDGLPSLHTGVSIDIDSLACYTGDEVIT